MVVPEMITGSSRLEISKHGQLIEYNIENITVSEVFLDSGRVVGEILLLVMGIISSRVFDIIALSLMCVVIAIYFIQTGLITKKYVVKNKGEERI